MRELTEALILTNLKQIRNEINERIESIKIVEDKRSKKLTDEVVQLRVVHAIESNRSLK